MKRLLLFSILFIFFTPFAQEDILSEYIDTGDEYVRASASFRAGNAKNGKQYFMGLLSEVINVDVMYRKIELLDEDNAPEQSIITCIDSNLALIQGSRKAIQLYADRNWPKRREFDSLTFLWLDGIEHLLITFEKPLAGPRSRPDSTWSDDEFDFYEEYSETYNDFLDLDEIWVEFQHEYAAANGFMLSTETIDVDAIAGETESKTDSTTISDYQSDFNSFENGEVSDAESYFYGVLASVILTEAHILKTDLLDEQNAPADSILSELDKALDIMDRSQKTMEAYKNRHWNRQKEFDDLTEKWFRANAILINSHLKRLAEAMSKPDELLTEEDLRLYNTYWDADDKMLIIDDYWVNFQNKFASANGFEVGETIYTEDLLEK